MSTCRRLNIEHEINEHHRQQIHLSNLHFYKHREQVFNRKITHLKKSFEQIEPCPDGDDDDDDRSLLTPNCLARVQNHFRLLNFSSETEKRLLGPTPSKLAQKRNSNPFLRRPSLSPSRPSTHVSCRSARNPSARIKPDMFETKTFQSYLDQEIIDEQQKQARIKQRKSFLLKEFDELKHTIDDPYAAVSVLAALSRAFLMFDSGTE